MGVFGVLKILSLAVIIDTQSGWKAADIEVMVQRANRLLIQCQIQISVDEPSFYTGRIEMNYDSISFANAIYKEKKKPVMFLVQDTQYNGSAGWAPGGNYLFVSSHVLTSAYKEIRHPEYEILAHELGHMLGDLKHLTTQEKNLMSGYVLYQSGQLTREQCERMRSSAHLQEVTPF